MIKASQIFMAIAISGFLTSCGEDNSETSIETPPIVFEKEGELFLLKQSDTIQTVDIEIADNEYERSTGLMYRESMEEHQGMLFIYPDEAPRSFYMKNTYIPLDIIFYGKDSTVVSFQKDAKPRDETSLPSNAPAQFILELNAGKVDQWNIQVGDKMAFLRE